VAAAPEKEALGQEESLTFWYLTRGLDALGRSKCLVRLALMNDTLEAV
jgi:hypothetical protein